MRTQNTDKVRYGHPFLVHTYLHHVTRLDHRHNFSPYNVLLYQTSADPATSTSFHAESLAFIPQLLLSCFLIPLVVAKKDLATSMMAQTFAFVTFNKVCTSQVRSRTFLNSHARHEILSYVRRLILTEPLSVFPVVHGLPATLPTAVVPPPQRQARHSRPCLVDHHTGRLAAKWLQPRVSRPEYLLPRPVALLAGLLSYQLLDTGHHHKRRSVSERGIGVKDTCAVGKRPESKEGQKQHRIDEFVRLIDFNFFFWVCDRSLPAIHKFRRTYIALHLSLFWLYIFQRCLDPLACHRANWQRDSRITTFVFHP